MAPAKFSTRTSWDSTESELFQAIREARAQGRTLLDLTISNPTVCGFEYDTEATKAVLTDASAMTYDPDPKGRRSARESISLYYADHQAQLNPDHLILTASTSEAYSFLFRLLCDPSDAVLIAQPSYPLFGFLADLDDITLHSYPLFYDYGWWIDFAVLEQRITPRTRAILLVHPNNPTGHATSLAERERLESICVCHGLALIVDEVFLDYGLQAPINSFAGGPHPCLTFILSGLSKVAALPQMKIAWIATFGPRDLLRSALERLEITADTLLSVNGPAQSATPLWLDSRHSIQGQILERLRENFKILDREGIPYLPVEAGWSAILRLPRTMNSEDLAKSLVQDAGLIVQPGSLFGLASNHSFVISLLGPTNVLAQGLFRLSRWIESNESTLASKPDLAHHINGDK